MANGRLQQWKQQLGRNMRQRFGVLPFRQAQSALEAWVDTPLGKALISEESERLDQALSFLFGYHLLELSISNRVRMARNSRVQHCFSLAPFQPRLREEDFDEGNPDGISGMASAQGVADIEHLPLASEALDVVLLHHVLEFSENPHQLLREASRVLIPRGHVVIVGFNPVSSFGLFKLFGRLFGRGSHWRHHSLRLARIVDWLHLLDFETVKIEQGFYRPPLQQTGIMKRLHWLERWGKRFKSPMGGFYLIVARKDVAAMTAIKPQWQSYNPIRSLGVRKASPRVSEPVTRTGNGK